MIRFIGDIHAMWTGYENLIKNCDKTIQIGDFGLGFPGYDFPEHLLKIPGNHRFIRGNHDNPEVCQNHPWYLGDYGYIKENDMFYLGGAWTPDFYKRTEGIDWWREEELEYKELQDAVDLYVRVKPTLVVTHECPRTIKKHLGLNRYPDNDGNPFKRTRTDNALQVMFEMHQPNIWVFGHYHRRIREREKGTLFCALEKFGIFDLD